MRCVTLIVLYSEMDTQCDKLTNQRRRSNVKRRKLSTQLTSTDEVTSSLHLAPTFIDRHATEKFSEVQEFEGNAPEGSALIFGDA